MAAAIAHLIASEMVNVIETPCRISVITKMRQLPSISVSNIETIVYMAVEVGRAVKPRAGTDEETAAEPFRAVVPVGSAGVWSVVIIAVRAYGWRSDVDVDLSL